jgi:iron complex outermembrane receptor protein
LEGGTELTERVTAAITRLRRYEQSQGENVLVLAKHRVASRLAVGALVPLGARFLADALLSGTCLGADDADVCDRVDPEGRVGASYEGESIQVYSNLGHYIRQPSLGELFGTSVLVRGNPALRSERGYTGELGARWQHANAARRLAWVDAAAFARYSSLLVDYVRTAQGYLTPRNNDSARTLGSELLVGVAPWRMLELAVSASLLDPRDTSADRQTVNDILPFKSRLLTTALASFGREFDSLWLGFASLSARYHYQASRFADPAGLAVIPAQSTLDLELLTAHLERRLEMRWRVANALDATRFDVVGFPLPGRSYFWSTEVTW